MIDRLLKAYGSPDLVIDKVKNNPYILVNEVEGVGWSKADDIAIAGGVDPLGVLRIKEYIKYYLNQCGKNGMSWVTTDQLLGAILDNVSEDVADEDITAAIRELGDKLWYSDDKQRIGLRKYHILAENIAKELLRIRDAESKFEYDGWEQRVKNLEDEQGWKFTDEQKSGIEAGLKNNIILIHAAAGCVDCDTEFFTGTKWKRIADYQPGDQVLQYNEDGTANLVEPLRYIKQPAQKLYHFETKYG